MATSPSPFSNRRRFLQTALAGAIVGPHALTLARAAAPTAGAPATTEGFPEFARGEVVRTKGEITKDGRFVEAQRAIPIAGRSQVLVVGAGPAGISAAYEAKKQNLNYVVIEKHLIGSTIYNYPVGLTVFSTTNELEFDPGGLNPAREKPTREELLSYYVLFVLDNELNIQTEEIVREVRKVDGGRMNGAGKRNEFADPPSPPACAPKPSTSGGAVAPLRRAKARPSFRSQSAEPAASGAARGTSSRRYCLDGDSMPSRLQATPVGRLGFNSNTLRPACLSRI